MPIDFPSSPSPSLNDTYSYGGNTWQWDGESWVSVGGLGPQGPQGPSGPTSNAFTVSIAPTFAGALIAANVSKSLSATTWTALDNLDETIYDTHNFVSTSSRITIPAGVSKVKLSGALRGASATSQLICKVVKNGSQGIIPSTAVDIDSTGEDSSITITPALSVSQNDYFELWGYTENSRSIPASNNDTWLSIEVVEGSILSNTATLASAGPQGPQGPSGTGTGNPGAFKNSFVGDGSSNTFTLTIPPTSEAHTLVFVNSILQTNSDYNVSSSNIVFTSSPESNAAIEVIIIGDSGPQGPQGPTLTVTANGGSVLTSGNVNFVNTSSVTVSVSNNSGVTNVAFTSTGGGGGSTDVFNPFLLMGA